jgi:hypothetical protein
VSISSLAFHFRIFLNALLDVPEDQRDVYAEEHLFAPQDQAITNFVHKKDSFGLGYDPYKNAPEFNRTLPLAGTTL